MQLEVIDSPSYAQFEPVGQCNLRCEMCPIQFRTDGPPYGPPAFMKWDVFVALLEQMPALKELHLQGLGEPMMHPRFIDMVSHAANRGIVVSTNSNMTILNETKAKALVRSGLHTLHVSIDGATAQTYESIRKRAYLDKTLSNIRMVMRERHNLGSDLPHLKLVMVIMRRNLHELPDVVKLAWNLGAESIFVQHLCHDFGEDSLPDRYLPMRQYVDDESLLSEDKDRISELFGRAETVAGEVGIQLRLPKIRAYQHPPGTPGPERCDWPWHGPYVAFDGTVMPCCMIATPDRFNLGNGAMDGIDNVWNNAAYQAFRRDLASDQPPSICKSCSVYTRTF